MYQLSPSSLPSVPTLRQLQDEYFATRNVRPKTEKEYRYVVERCLSDWLDLRITDITADMVLKRHRYSSRTAPSQANYCFRVLRALFSYAVACYEHPNGQPVLVANPVRKLTLVRGWNRDKSRLKEYIPAEHIGKWWRAVDELKNKTMRDYLKVLLLTGLRKQELAELPWSCVDLDGGFIIITAERSKNHKQHRVPVSDYVRAVLTERRRNSRSDFVFPCAANLKAPLSAPYHAVRQIREKTGIYFRPHSLRRSFSSLCTHPRIQAHEAQIKMLLNHAANDPLYKHYVSTHPEALRLVTQRVTNLVLYLAESS